MGFYGIIVIFDGIVVELLQEIMRDLPSGKTNIAMKNHHVE